MHPNRLSVLCTTLLFLPAASLAQAPAPDDTVDWAVCLSGEGCQVCESSLSHEQADHALGAMGLISDAPGHTVTVMRKKDGEWTWYYDTRRPAPALDKYFGGPGRNKQGACTAVQLPGDHQPKDGTWQVANGQPALKNCPAALAQQVQQMQLFRSGQVAFTKPFRASDALPGKDVAWLQSGPNQHVASFSPAGSAGLKARYALQVESPEKMSGTLQVAAPIPGQPTCEVSMPFTYLRSGD